VTKQIHDVNDLISEKFFKNPVAAQPLRTLLKKSQSEPRQFEEPKKSITFREPSEKLCEESRRVEEELLRESEEDSAKENVREKTNKFPKITKAVLEERNGEEREMRNSPSIISLSQASDVTDASKLTSEPDTEPRNKFFETERVLEDGTIERTLADGRVESVFPNGNRKVVSPGGKCTKIVFYNGDVQEVFEDGTVEYFFAESRTWHTTRPDGSELIELPR
jgi:hypothetical protein